MSVEIYQDRSIACAASESKIVDPEHTHRRARSVCARDHSAAYQPQKSVATGAGHLQVEGVEQAAPGLSPQRERHGLQALAQGRCLSLIAGSHAGKTFAEGVPRTGRVQTAVAPRMDAEAHRNDAQRHVSQDAVEPAMRAA
jgi:hypothetical protein